jgi:glycosyltransferase involved in cell wall biosynthesis
MALVEAYAAGVPVIASRLGSLEELVEDGRTGLHVAPGDATDLARALAWSHDHPEDMQRMGEAARHRYEERYTPEANYAQLMAIYAHAREEHGGAMRRAARPISAGEGAGG